MRSEVNKEELSRLYDLDKLDAIASSIGNQALINLGLEVFQRVDEVLKMSRRRDASPTGLNKEFSDMLSYCIEQLVNTINLNGERGIIHANSKVRDWTSSHFQAKREPDFFGEYEV